MAAAAPVTPDALATSTGTLLGGFGTVVVVVVLGWVVVVVVVVEADPAADADAAGAATAATAATVTSSLPGRKNPDVLSSLRTIHSP